MKHLMAFLCAGLGLCAFSANPSPLPGEWRLNPYAKLAGNILVVDVPTNRPAFGAAYLPCDLSPFDGKMVCAEVRARGFRLAPTPEKWEGLKFMISYRDGKDGQTCYPGAPQIVGDFPWQTLRLTDLREVSARRNGMLTLGIQNGTGRVEFDLSTLKIREMPPLWPKTNAAHRCVYTDRVKAWPVLKGVMLGHGMKEADFRTLHDWGATLARFQMSRDWNTVGGNRDLADYDRYIDNCLDDLERHLAWARKYGIKIVVDLHAAPGARDARHDLAMCHDKTYADHFIVTWRRIAARFKGREEIYGFDLVNEPQQTLPALPGCDYWSLQCRAAEAIRAIDPETPVIIESNLYDAPRTFSYLAPLALTNIIYQAHMYVPGEYTHQGVFNRAAPVVRYPGLEHNCTPDGLRRALEPVRAFQERHGARILIGEFSAIVWAPGAAEYIRDCIRLFDEYGWDWAFHAFREWSGWSVEHVAPARWKMVPSADNPRKRALLEGLKPRPERLGVGMECLDRDLWDPFPAMPHLKELGIRKVRLQSGWARTEKEKGRLDFAWLDRIVSALGEIGVTPWISLSYGNPIYAAPCDGEQSYTGQKMNPLHSPEGLEAWKRYVKATVARYKDRVDTWEIWNEPDVVFFWKAAEGSTWADEYARFARLTAEAVRQVQPTAKIAVCTASGPAGDERNSLRLFELGVGDFADIYSFHAYRARPEVFDGQTQRAFYGAVRRHAPKIAFWRGEAGLSSQRSGRGALHDLPLSEEMQARWMSRHLVRDLADPELAFTSYFHLFDFDHFTHEVTYHYGVLRDKDYSRKPSFGVLQRVKRFLDDGLARPDAVASLSLAPVDGKDAAAEAKVAGAAIYAFRRRGCPLFAFTATGSAAEAMPPVEAKAQAFLGDSFSQWRDPVLLDLLDGSVERLDLREAGTASHLRVKLANHVKLLTEAAALAPHLLLPLRAPAPGAAPAAQKDHE